MEKEILAFLAAAFKSKVMDLGDKYPEYIYADRWASPCGSSRRDIELFVVKDGKYDKVELPFQKREIDPAYRYYMELSYFDRNWAKENLQNGSYLLLVEEKERDWDDQFIPSSTAYLFNIKKDQ